MGKDGAEGWGMLTVGALGPGCGDGGGQSDMCGLVNGFWWDWVGSLWGLRMGREGTREWRRGEQESNGCYAWGRRCAPLNCF